MKMSRTAAIEKLEKKQFKTNVDNFAVGDTVRIHTRIIEGQKERIQIFTGTVIARKGVGTSETFSVHRVAYGEGMERVFLLHSPRIAKIEIVKEGHVRKSKLYYLRGTSGKASKVKGRIGSRRAQEIVQPEALEGQNNVTQTAAASFENESPSS
jgi:large subunit ribosomal protein L19